MRSARPQLGGATSREHSLVVGPNLLQQPDGIAAVSGPGYYGGPPNLIALPRWDHAGNKVAEGQRYGDHLASAPNPDGGVLLAGDFSASYSGPTEHVGAMFTGGSAACAVEWGPKRLASAGTVFGAGVDLLGRCRCRSRWKRSWTHGSHTCTWRWWAEARRN